MSRLLSFDADQGVNADRDYPYPGFDWRIHCRKTVTSRVNWGR